ncbi:MAG: ABC transporter permease [Acidobacteria bacterium]|nr:ABC transporter permease [Acidobacteriota bacterium]
MRRRPGGTALAVTTLALCIGMNVAAFAVAYGVLIRPLPYPDASRLAVLNILFHDGGDLGFSPDALQQCLPRLRTVESAAGYVTTDVTVRSAGRAHVYQAALVTESFFEVLGAPAALGHTRVRLDAPDIVVSSRAAASLIGADLPDAIGSAVSIGDRPHVIGGIVDPAFAFPAEDVSLWLPSPAMTPGTRSQDGGYSKIVARLKPGTTLDQFRDDASRVCLEPSPTGRETVSVAQLGETVVGSTRTLLAGSLVGALLVLVVGCANVTTLFIGRDVSRRRELVTRMAVGASPARLVRGVLVEIALIAGIAALAGSFLGWMTIRVLTAQAADAVAGLRSVHMDAPVLAAIVALTFLTTMLCAIAPAWHATHLEFAPAARGTTESLHAWQVRRILVVAQIAVSCVLLVSAGLLARTVSTLVRADHGFQARGAIAAKLTLSDTGLLDSVEKGAYLRALVARVNTMPGVRYAGIGSNLPPLTAPAMMLVRLVRGDRDESRFLKVGSAGPGYLRALGVKWIAGRDFEDAENRPDAPVVILSESTARFYFPDEDAIGRTITGFPASLGLAGDLRVVGVVRDVKYDGLDTPAGGAIYVPWARLPLGKAYLIVRGDDNVRRLAPMIGESSRQLDASVPVPDVQTLDDVVARSIAARRARALPAIGFGGLGLCVALAGVLATLITLVTERRREMAIRSAIGASPDVLVRTIVGQGLVLIAAGLVVGLGGAALAARALSSLLHGVAPLDPTTFISTALLIGSTATTFAWLAARRVRSVTPMVVLREE